MVENPWEVDSIEEFYYLKCPECSFDTKEEFIFQDHATENHPLSLILFGKALKLDNYDASFAVKEPNVKEEITMSLQKKSMEK